MSGADLSLPGKSVAEWRMAEGLDDIGPTFAYAAAINARQEADAEQRPWAVPA